MIDTLAAMLLFGLTVLAPVVGATFGALDTITRMFASGRKPFMSAYARMGGSPGARYWLTEATHLAQRADRTMLGIATEIDADRPLTPTTTSACTSTWPTPPATAAPRPT